MIAFLVLAIATDWWCAGFAIIFFSSIFLIEKSLKQFKMSLRASFEFSHVVQNINRLCSMMHPTHIVRRNQRFCSVKIDVARGRGYNAFMRVNRDRKSERKRERECVDADSQEIRNENSTRTRFRAHNGWHFMGRSAVEEYTLFV